MKMPLEEALKKALEFRDLDSLDAAWKACGDEASGNDQIAQLAGFLYDSMDCHALQEACDAQHFDREQAREWDLDAGQYCLAHEIALVARMVERKREGLKDA